MTSHVTVFHCPYCASEDLRPHEGRRGAWECRSCLRAFGVSFVGLLAAPGGERA